MTEGDVLFPLVVEFTMKSDEQGDPLITGTFSPPIKKKTPCFFSSPLFDRTASIQPHQWSPHGHHAFDSFVEEEMVANAVADWARIETMKSLARRAFLILEKAWKRLNVTLVDFKVYIDNIILYM